MFEGIAKPTPWEPPEREKMGDPDAGARQRRDDAAGHGLADAERVADRQHQVAHFQVVGIAKLERRQLAVLDGDAQHRQIGALVGKNDLGLELAPVGQRDDDLLGALDDVVVGDDDAVAAHDDARSQ
jgi:hypothetical protein